MTADISLKDFTRTLSETVTNMAVHCSSILYFLNINLLELIGVTAIIFIYFNQLFPLLKCSTIFYYLKFRLLQLDILRHFVSVAKVML